MKTYTFNELKRAAGKESEGVTTKIKIALLADSATQFVRQAIKGYGALHNTQYDIWEADYNQIDLQVFDPGSELYMFNPDYVLILRSSEHLLHSFYKKPLHARSSFCKDQLNYINDLCKEINGKLKCKIITNNFFEINDSVFGNYANKVDVSFLYQIRRLNVELMDMAQEHKNVFVLDMAAMVSNAGYLNAFDSKLYINGDMVHSIDFLPHLAQNIHGIISAVNGRFNKCLILDLDNTTWGGVIGDDGIEGINIGALGIGKAFTELQLWAKQLKERGIILAVCSKNTESIAKEAFEKHPDMELRLEDIALFVANWENKVDNIRYIQSVLQIGFDSMVFLDDNPFEREMVKLAIPDITVPELPEDPAEYMPYLRALNLFETASYTEEDSVRTKQYQEEAGRVVLQKSFANEAEFLQSLEMRSEVAAFNSFTIPRVAQLTQRSNQFNLRTKRYTEDDILRLSASPDHITLTLTLDDKFGQYGLIAVIILEKRSTDTLFIDTWIMSCRVLKRGMEQFTLFCIASEAHKMGFKHIIGQYIPTPKNGIVANHYQNLGFTNKGDEWNLDIDENILQNKSFISFK